MNYRTLALAAIVATTAMPSTALAANRSLSIYNASNGCAWITVYKGTQFAPWNIVNQGPNRPQALKAGGTLLFPISGDSSDDLKVRAEIKKHADCSGSNIADIEDYRKNLSYGHRTVKIWNDANGYHITF